MRLLQTARQIVICFFLLTSFSYAATTSTHQNRLIGYTYLGEFTKSQARETVLTIPVLNLLSMNYALHVYKILYNTPAPDGHMTIASGLVAMPETGGKSVSIVSYQHGTRFNHDDAPSSNGKAYAMYLAAFSSHTGDMLVMPDYLGYGDSDLTIHPYIMAESLASSSINMLIAAKELAQELQYPTNDKLFLAGYSEGGFTTNVMYEKLLKSYPKISVTAVAPGSAPYDYNESLKFVTLQPGPRATAYMAYLMYSMQTYNHYWGGLDQIFVKPYDTLVPILFDGKHQNQEILDALPKDPILIFNKGFIDGILQGTDSHTPELIANFNHYDYKPTSPMLLVGTKGDRDVPYHGAEIAYAVFKQKSDSIYIKSVSSLLDHITAFPLVTMAQISFFKKYDS